MKSGSIKPELWFTTLLSTVLVNKDAGRHGNSHASDTLVESRVVRERSDLSVRQLSVFLNTGQLIDLQVGHLDFLLRVDHLHLQL